MQIPGASSTKARGPGGQARRLWVLGGGGGPAVSRPHASHADGVRLNGSAAAAETLLTGLKGVQAVSQPAGLMPPASAGLSLPTVPAGLEPAASAAQPRAQRRLPIDPPGLQPSGSAQPQPPPPPLDQPKRAAPPPQLAASATTGGAGRGLKRKMTPSVGDDQGSEAMAAGRQMVADSTRRIAETGVTAATHPMAARPHARDTPRDAVDLLPPPPPGTTWRWQPSRINADGALALAARTRDRAHRSESHT